MPRLVSLLATVAVLPLGAGRAQSAPASSPSVTVGPPTNAAVVKGKPYFWWFGHPDVLVQFDPVSDTVVRKIKLEHGMTWGTHLSHDRKRFVVIVDQQRKVDVVDIATGAVLGEHDFTEEGFIVRVNNVMEIPGGTHWYVFTDRIKKHKDHYSFEPSQVLLYEVAARKVEKKLRRLPEPIDRGARISPDGSKWHVTNDDGDLAIVDPKTLKEEGKIDLHTPLYSGMGVLNLTGQDLNDFRDPKAYLMLCTLTDPVEVNRVQWGLATVDLENKKLGEIVEWGPNPGVWGLRVAAKKRVAAAMTFNNFGAGAPFGGRSPSGVQDRRVKLQLYDLTTGKKTKETLQEFRPRRGLVAIAPDGDKVYVGIAGSDLEVFDAELRPLKTLEFDHEVAGQIFVVDG